MDYDVAFVPPMSLPALDALQNLPTDFTSALDTLQRQNIIDTFSRVDFLTKGTIQPKLPQLKCLVSLRASSRVVIKAATDASKTLATMLPLFLSPNKYCHAIETTAKGSRTLDNSNLALYFPGSFCRSTSFFSSVSHPSPSTMIPRMTKHYGMYVDIVLSD